MLTRDAYFKLCLREKKYESRAWVITVLSEVIGDQGTDELSFHRDEKGNAFTYMGGQKTEIEGNYFDRPFVLPQDKLVLNPGDLPNVKTKVNTNFYEAIFNACLFVYPVGDKIEYFAGEKSINIGKLEHDLAARMVDDPSTPAEKERAEKEKLITVSDWIKICEGAGFLRGLSQIVAPSGSPATFTVSQAVLKRRDELLAQHAEELDDPAVMSAIQKELADLDQETFKGDPSETFFVNPGKQFGVARMKLHVMVGRETGFGNTGEGAGTITHSLTEPKSPEDMVIMNNAMRSGSYARGKETEKGGEIVNLINKTFQNTTLTEEDCGSTVGLEWVVSDANKSMLEGTYQILGNKIEELTEERLNSLIGKTVFTRTPLACKTPPPALCKTCMGVKYGVNPTGLVSAASSMPSAVMYIFMKAFHGKKLATAEIKLEDVIS